MTMNGRYCAAPVREDLRLYTNDESSSFSIVTHEGKRRFKATGDGATKNVIHLNTVGERNMTKTYRWPVIGEWYFVGTLATSQRVVFMRLANSTAHCFAVLEDGAGNFNVELGTMIGEDWLGTRGISTNAFSTGVGNKLRIRYQTDGSRHKVWINSVLEIDIADATQAGANTTFALVNSTLGASQDMYWWGLITLEGDSEADRPNDVPTFGALIPSADTSEDDAFPNGGAPTDDDHNWWDDYEAAETHDGDTTYLLFDAAAVRQHVSELAPSEALTGDIMCVMWREVGRAATSDKSGNSDARIKDDGGAAKNLALSNTAVETYVGRYCVFDVPPDSGSWEDFRGTDDKFNGASASQLLEAGLETPEENDVNLRITSLLVEVGAIGNDPPVVSGFPRAFVAVIG